MNKSYPRSKIVLMGAALVVAFTAGRWSHLELQPPQRDRTELSNAQPEPRTNGQIAKAASAAEIRATEAARLAKRVAQPATSLADEEEQQRLIQQWAELDAPAALEFIRTQLKGDRQAQALANALSIFGKNDPAKAWAWVTQEMPTATHHFDNLLEVFGRNSPQVAEHYAAEYAAAHPESALEVNLAALLGVTYTGNFAAAKTFVESRASLPPEIRGNLDNFVAGQWARFAPNEAAAWVLSLPPGERDQALIGLGESWSENDPSAATAFAYKLAPGSARTLAMRQAISKWVETDPETARSWVLNTDRHEDFDQAVQSIATENNFMHREPARALRWAAGIFDGTLREQSVNQILTSWYPADPQAATAYIENSPDFTPQQRADLLRKLRENG